MCMYILITLTDDYKLPCIVIIYRHPDSTQRPSFKNIESELNQDTADILSWTVKDRTVHPQVSLLAEELDIARELYKDLQNTYVRT